MNSVIEKNINYYNILNIQREAAIKEIKKSYKRLALKFHPDVCKTDDSSDKFKVIVKAYTTLKDVDLRKEYDKQLDKNEGFFPKIIFKYSFKEFAKTTDKIVNNFKIFFKNISDKKFNKSKLEKENFFGFEMKIPESVLNMSLEELSERLQYSENSFVRTNAAIAIGYKKEKKGLTFLERMIMDPDYEARKAVIWAIGNLKMRKSLKFLKILYNSTISPLKLEILKSIYKIMDGKGNLINDLLIQACSDEFEEVKVGALKMFLLSGKKIMYKNVKDVFGHVSFESRELIEKLLENKKIVV